MTMMTMMTTMTEAWPDSDVLQRGRGPDVATDDDADDRGLARRCTMTMMTIMTTMTEAWPEYDVLQQGRGPTMMMTLTIMV